jgi:hypothetical protein
VEKQHLLRWRFKKMQGGVEATLRCRCPPASPGPSHSQHRAGQQSTRTRPAPCEQSEMSSNGGWRGRRCGSRPLDACAQLRLSGTPLVPNCPPEWRTQRARVAPATLGPALLQLRPRGPPPPPPHRLTLDKPYGASLRGEVGPVNLKFTIPMFSASRINLKYLQVRGGRLPRPPALLASPALAMCRRCAGCACRSAACAGCAGGARPGLHAWIWPARRGGRVWARRAATCLAYWASGCFGCSCGCARGQGPGAGPGLTTRRCSWPAACLLGEA